MRGICKRIVSLSVMLALLVAFCMPAYAYNSKVVKIQSYYSNYATCRLVDRRQPGYVRIQVNGNAFVFGYTQRNSVKMTTTTGRYIWAEDGAIRLCGARTFYLGNDHSAYRIYVRTNYDWAQCVYTNYGNVSIT